MLVKTILRIARHLDMSVDDLSIDRVDIFQRKVEYYISDKSNRFKIEIYSTDEKSNLCGFITNPNDQNFKKDLLCALIEYGII
jgi:hypothetical protein